MRDDESNVVVCHFRVIPGKEEEFLEIQREHDRTIRKLDLVTDEPSVIYRGEDPKGRPFLYKIFEWKSPAALAAAHDHPELMMIWERMEHYCEARDGQLSMEFPHVERITL